MLLLGVCKSLKRLVGASGFEPPTSWSRTKDPRRISDLAVLPTIANNCAKLLVFKGFQEVRAAALATVRNASMRGMGTKMGTVVSLSEMPESASASWEILPRRHLRNPQNPQRRQHRLRNCCSAANAGSTKNSPPVAPGSPTSRRRHPPPPRLALGPTGAPQSQETSAAFPFQQVPAVRIQAGDVV